MPSSWLAMPFGVIIFRVFEIGKLPRPNQRSLIEVAYPAPIPTVPARAGIATGRFTSFIRK
jgi:hypothetical protein